MTNLLSTVRRRSVRIFVVSILALFLAALLCFFIAKNYNSAVGIAIFGILAIFLFALALRSIVSLYQMQLEATSRHVDVIAKNLQLRTQDVAELTEKLQSIFDTTEEAIIVMRAPHEIISANASAYRLFGLPPAAVHTTESFFFGSPAILGLIETCLREGKASIEQFSMLKDKNEIILSARAQRFAVNQSDAAVIVISDITASKRIELTKKNFVANVSHELRTPVQIVRGYAEMLSTADIPEESKSWADIILHQSLRMERIVSDLLMLAKLEHDPASWIVRERFAIKPVLEEAAQTVKLQYPEIRLIAIDCPDALEIEASPGLIEQAAFNLISNAAQHSGSHDKIMVGAMQENEDFVLRVRDYGAGIPPKDLEHIFERFYRADKSRSQSSLKSGSGGGSGLGLAIVKHIASAHGGTVRAESWAGEGALFEFRIPAKSSNL